MIRDLQLRWPTVAVVAIVLATVCVLVIFGRLDIAVVAGAVGTLVTSMMRKSIVKPEPTELDERLKRYLKDHSSWPPSGDEQ